MLTCLKHFTPAELAQYFFDHRNEDMELTFYAGYDDVTQEPEYAYLARICNFAEARSLFINYLGGGNLFCYEFSGDMDASCLIGLLDTYSFHNDFNEGVWAVLPPEPKTAPEGAPAPSGTHPHVILTVEEDKLAFAFASDPSTQIEVIYPAQTERMKDLKAAVDSGRMTNIEIR